MNIEELNEQLRLAEQARSDGRLAEAEKMALELASLCDDQSIDTYDIHHKVRERSFHKDTETDNDALNIRVRAMQTLMNIAVLREEYKSALSIGRDIEAIAERYVLRRVQAHAWNVIGIALKEGGSFTEALEYYEKAVIAHEAMEDFTMMASDLQNIGNVCQHLGQYRKAPEYLQRALELYRSQGFQQGVVAAIGNIATNYYFLAEYDRSLEYFSQAVQAAREMSNPAYVARILGNTAAVYSAMGIYDKALEYDEQALALHESLNERSGVTRLTGNIAVMYTNLQMYDQALEYFQRALSMHEELGELAGMAIVMSGIGGVHLKLGNVEKSLEYFGKALAEEQRLGLAANAATTMGNMGIAYKQIGSYEHALECYQKALRIHEELEEKLMIARVHGNIGQLYADPENENFSVSVAEEYLRKTLSLCDEVQERSTKSESLKALSALYRTHQRWEEADRCFQQFYEIEKQMHGEQVTKEAQQLDHRRKVEAAERDRQVKLARFQEQEKILHNILPSQIANRIIEGERTIADSYQSVSVFFSDIVGFTQMSQRVSPEELVNILNGIFTEFDKLARLHGLEKIKTIGDAYMAVAGAPVSQENHAEHAALFALDVSQLMKNYRSSNGDQLQLRIGLHTGSAVAGVIGADKFAYDLWGDAVNTASRMESHGEAGKIHVSEEFRDALITDKNTLDNTVVFVDRGLNEIKGKGAMRTYFMEKI